MSKRSPEDITKALKEMGIVEEKKEEVQEVELEEAPLELEQEDEVPEESSQPELSEVEQEAMEKGWKPDGPKSAEEFLRAEPLYEEIKLRGKEIKSLKSQVDELMKHVGNLKKAGYQERIDLIQAERDEAIARSDVDSVNYLDEELSRVKSELQKESQPIAHPAVLDFEERHKDLINDFSLEAQEIKEFLLQRDQQLASYNLDPEVHIKTLDRDLQLKFPERFGSKPKDKSVPLVESDNVPVSTKKKAKYSFSDLNPVQKKVYKYMEHQFKETGKGMNGDKYIKQLIELGEL